MCCLSIHFSAALSFVAALLLSTITSDSIIYLLVWTQYRHSINKHAHMQVTIIGRKRIAHSPSMSFVLNFAWCFLFSYWCIIQYSIHDTSIIWYTDSKNHNSDEYSKFDTLYLQVTILPMTYGMRHSPPSWRSPSLW